MTENEGQAIGRKGFKITYEETTSSYQKKKEKGKTEDMNASIVKY